MSNRLKFGPKEKIRMSMSALTVVVGILFAALCPTQTVLAQKNTLTVLMPAEFSHLDPAEILSEDQAIVKYHIYNCLYKFNEKMEPVRDLVVNESVAADGKTWTFNLRPGVLFHDGTPCNAEAIRYTIERMVKGEGKMEKTLFAPIAEVIVKSETSLVIVTKGLFPALRNNLAHPDSAIVSPAADQKLGKNFGRQPVGAGPYRFSEWLTGDHITLVRNEKYYGPRPFFERIVFKFVGDATTRSLMIETGQADVILRAQPADLPRLRNNSALRVAQVPGRNLYFTLNCAKPPFQDLRVRQAVNYAVDKKVIIDRILSGSATPAHTISGGVQYAIDAGFYEYNPERAKTLIKEAGAVGAKVKLVSPTTRYLLDSEVAQAVAGYLRQAGLNVEVQLVGDWPTFVDIVRKREFDGHMMGLGAATGDPDMIFRLTLIGKNAGKLWNAGSYNNPKVDDLIEEGAKEFDKERRANIYAEIQKTVWNDAPWLFLYRLTVATAYKSEIQGIEMVPGSQWVKFWGAYR